jgi:hypothetical protein
MEIGIGGADFDDAMLPHEGGDVKVMQAIAVA